MERIFLIHISRDVNFNVLAFLHSWYDEECKRICFCHNCHLQIIWLEFSILYMPKMCNSLNKNSYFSWVKNLFKILITYYWYNKYCWNIKVLGDYTKLAKVDLNICLQRNQNLSIDQNQPTSDMQNSNDVLHSIVIVADSSASNAIDCIWMSSNKLSNMCQ